jgi:hypothetical protein
MTQKKARPMLTPAREQELMPKAIQAFECADIATMTKAEASAYLTSVMHSAYSLLRTLEDDHHLRGRLDAAITGLANPVHDQHTEALLSVYVDDMHPTS